MCSVSPFAPASLFSTGSKKAFDPLIRTPFLFLSSQINKWMRRGEIPLSLQTFNLQVLLPHCSPGALKKASINELNLQWDISTCLNDILNHGLNGSGGRGEQVFTSCSLLGYSGFMAVNSKQHCYCLFTFYQPPLFIYVDFDWWRHFKKGGEKGGGGEEYFNSLVSNSCKSTVHTARVLLKRKAHLCILGNVFSFYQSLFFLKDWKWGASSASNKYLITVQVAHDTAISQENQCWSF